MLSERVQRIGMSPTMKVAGIAKKMIAEGIDVVDLSVGEPDFATPDNIKTAGIHAIETNNTRYTPNAGMPKLKDAIIHRFAEDHDLTYQPDEILVSPGAKNSLYNLCAAIFNPGDEAIIPAPYWVSYPSMAALTDAVSVFVDTNESDGFLMTPEALKSAITPKSKALFLNNPSNPSGAFYERDQLEKIVRVAVDAGLVIISDEIYEKLIY
ncbi:aminotransferase class I/II-fold pyridoxal phosphate-dependent enzyme, partial [bacterium]|nr:aminotransferase class I/II-fold pyridoxal phosphate-dependent enzyme [bacterium]